MKRLIAIGDIHGELAPLLTLLEVINPTQDDTIVFMGDYIDRGKQSYEVIQTIIELMANSPAKIVALKGNHEDMMIKSLLVTNRDSEMWQYNWFNNGGFDTLDSYTANSHKHNPSDFEKYKFNTIPDSHVEFLLNLDNYYETDNHIFCHATPYDTDNMDEQTDDALFWKRPNKNDKLNGYHHKSGKLMVNGHTPIGSKPSLLGKLLLIDTGIAYPEGRLTAFDVLSMSYNQTDKNAQRVIKH